MSRLEPLWKMSRLLWLLGLLLASAHFGAAEKMTSADYFVKSLPGQPEGPLINMHAGHIEVDQEHNGNLFFWHFQNRHVANRKRTVIWLNGGPGCSSMDGALMEIGPYRLKNQDELRYSEGSWDEFANLLFVDQPVGTGFSYVDSNSYLHELAKMSQQFIDFLDKWFALFPEYESDHIYIAGESYAGQYIPYIARAILDRNNELQKRDKARWNLQGLLIGNGWVDPIQQYLAYLPFAYDAGVLEGGSEAANKVEAQQTKCRAELDELTGGDTSTIRVNACEAVLTKMLDLTKDGAQCLNQYDVRLRDPACGMAWPPDLANMKPYLRRQDVTDALHINRDKRTGWSECSSGVGTAFSAANSPASVTLLPGILEAGVPILLFSGDQDLICNHLGTEEFIHSMVWSGGTGFELSPGVWAPKRDWVFENEAAGIYQEARNLTYVLFYNSSHMVPFDFPRRTRDMLDRFMKVDIASIGGSPADSRIDGEKAGVETSVGGHPNSTAAVVSEEKKLHDVERNAYFKSGAAVLVLAAIAIGLWSWLIWVRRRKRGYSSVPRRENGVSGLGLDLEASGRKRSSLEAADFDEHELEDHPGAGRMRDGPADNRYSLGSDSDSDSDHEMAGPGRDGGDDGRRPGPAESADGGSR